LFKDGQMPVQEGVIWDAYRFARNLNLDASHFNEQSYTCLRQFLNGTAGLGELQLVNALYAQNPTVIDRMFLRFVKALTFRRSTLPPLRVQFFPQDANLLNELCIVAATWLIESTWQDLGSLARRAYQLKILRLQEIGLQAKDLASLSIQITQFRVLEELDLSGNPIGSKGKKQPRLISERLSRGRLGRDLDCG
jgi:hypothetical protein